MKQILILTLFLLSCNDTNYKNKHQKNIKVYETTDRKGYTYYDNGLWYVYYLVGMNSYSYSGAYTTAPGYNSSAVSSWSPNSENVSNYSEIPAEAQADIQESSGEDAGGSVSEPESNTESPSESPSESSGESSGGSDGGGGD